MTIELVAPVTLSGKVLDSLGNGIPNQEVLLSPTGTNNWMTSITDAEGKYFFGVAPGGYDLYVRSWDNSPSVNAPRRYELYNKYWEGSTLSLTQSTIMDIPLPEHKVSVHVQDPAGNPVANVGITTNDVYNESLTLVTLPAVGYSYYPYWQLPATTDANGDVELWLFTTPLGGETYTLTADPESPFATFNVYDVAVVSDMTIIVVLEFDHPPPVTTASLSPAPDEQGVYPGPVTVTLSATAAEGFTVAATYYSVDGGPTQTYSAPFVISEDDTHTLEYWSVDNVGVCESPNTLAIEILSNQPPVADAGGPYSVDEGSSVDLSGSGSDPDSDPLTYSWDLDDDGIFETPGQSVTFSAAGLDGPSSHTIAVQVTDTGGLSATDQATVEVQNVAPTVSIDAVTPPIEGFILPGDAIVFTGSFTDPGSLDTHIIVWDFGDTSIATDTLMSPHSYADLGTYTVTLTVTDDDGGEGDDETTLEVLTVDEAVEVVDEIVQSLPDEAFVKNASQRKNALSHKFDGVQTLIADGQIQEAIDKLNHDLRAKADGCFGGNPNNDWIIECEAQAEVLARIDALVDYLEGLL